MVLTEGCGNQGIIQTLGKTVKTTTCVWRKWVNTRSNGNGRHTLSRHDKYFICKGQKVGCERVFVRVKSLVLRVRIE